MLQSATGLDLVPFSSEENQSATADPNVEEGISVGIDRTLFCVQ